MTMLADHVDFVIGVDTHKHTNTAAVVVASTGAALEHRTVPSTPRGHVALFEMAEGHLGRRAWAIEGTGSYGAGLTRFLSECGEQVIELDLLLREARRGGKKTDPLDAVRARGARRELGEPRAVGQRAALAVLLVARRSAVKARSDAQRQLHALIVTAPGRLRARFRGLSPHGTVARAARLRVSAGHTTSGGRRCGFPVGPSRILRLRGGAVQMVTVGPSGVDILTSRADDHGKPRR